MCYAFQNLSSSFFLDNDFVGTFNLTWLHVLQFVIQAVMATFLLMLLRLQNKIVLYY